MYYQVSSLFAVKIHISYIWLDVSIGVLSPTQWLRLYGAWTSVLSLIRRTIQKPLIKLTTRSIPYKMSGITTFPNTIQCLF